ncbi:heavy-metal-associated domain-containing protein [Mycoplasmatota bacterium]|nr:heavy-metal-associated domain-containing protein [Mycoplasmatota bacterium]
MKEIKVVNMACGHCRLKIESELISAGFSIVKFDMLNDIVMIEEGDLSVRDAYKAIEKAGYLIDKTYKTKDTQIVLKILNPIEEDIESEIRSFFLGEGISDLEFNITNQTLKINETNKEIEELIELLEIIGYDVELLD